MNWIKCKDPNPIRGKTYDRVLNVVQGINIHIDIYNKQPDSEMNLHVWIAYKEGKELRIFTGTEVECIRIIDKFAAKFNADELNPWE